jgi:hypothetical protein
MMRKWEIENRRGRSDFLCGLAAWPGYKRKTVIQLDIESVDMKRSQLTFPVLRFAPHCASAKR